MIIETKSLTSIQKALSLMNIFAREHIWLTLEDLTSKSNIPKTTVFRTLLQLEDYGYIQKKEQQGKTMYSLGFAFLEKAQLVRDNLDIREIAREEMMNLRNNLNLTVQLAIRNQDEAIYIEQFESWRPIRVYPAIGKRVPLYSAACPRVLLAYLNKKEQEWLLDRYTFQKVTSNTITDRAYIEQLIEETLEQGFTRSTGELFEGTSAIAVPIFDAISNEVLASLSVIGMTQDFKGDITWYVDKLKEAAQNITTQYS